nr:hypothetical protein [uncultured Draconibacterium sp.]
MKSRSKNTDKKEGFLSKLSTTWNVIISGLTLLSMGFAAGYYISDVFKKIEINQINQQHNVQLYNLTKDFDKKSKELTHKINLLEIENGKLRK